MKPNVLQGGVGLYMGPRPHGALGSLGPIGAHWAPLILFIFFVCSFIYPLIYSFWHAIVCPGMFLGPPWGPSPPRLPRRRRGNRGGGSSFQCPRARKIREFMYIPEIPYLPQKYRIYPKNTVSTPKIPYLPRIYPVSTQQKIPYLPQKYRIYPVSTPYLPRIYPVSTNVWASVKTCWEGFRCFTFFLL